VSFNKDERANDFATLIASDEVMCPRLCKPKGHKNRTIISDCVLEICKEPPRL